MNKLGKKVSSQVKGIDFEAFKKEAFKDAEFKAEYEALRPEFELLDQFIRARKRACLSQADLAKRLKSHQPAVARLELGGYVNTSITNLIKVADVLGYSLHVSLKEKKQ